MNKNWLYRILAIALVAMLALPMFAMAEEAAAFELGADGKATKAEQKLGVDANPWNDSADIDAIDLDTNEIILPSGVTKLTLNVDMATDWLNYSVVTGDKDEDGDYTVDWTMDSLTCVKNSKKKVLTCDKHNHITIKKPGTAVLTFKTTNAKSGEKVTIKLTVKVKDSSGFEIRDEADNSKIGKKATIRLGAPFRGMVVFSDPSGSDQEDEIAESAVCALRAVVKDPAGAPVMRLVDYEAPLSEDLGNHITEEICPLRWAKPASETADGEKADASDEYRINRIATYKSSNKSVLAVDPWSGELTALKTGSSTVTATLYDVVDRDDDGNYADAYPMKSIKIKIKVEKNRSAVNTNMKWALSSAKSLGDFYFGVKRAEYTKIAIARDEENVPYVKSAELKVTFFVANGTNTTQEDIYDPSATVKYFAFANARNASFGGFYADLADSSTGNTLLSVWDNSGRIATGRAKMKWTKGKITTFTKTFKLSKPTDGDLVVCDLGSPNSFVALTEFRWANRKNGSWTIWSLIDNMTIKEAE